MHIRIFNTSCLPVMDEKKISTKHWLLQNRYELDTMDFYSVEFNKTSMESASFLHENINEEKLKLLKEHNIRFEYEEPFIFEQANAR